MRDVEYGERKKVTGEREKYVGVRGERVSES